MKTKSFTFYSYKGGSGRSTTLVNTAKHLIDELKATPDEPILIVDADLESAGLTYFFKCDSRFASLLVREDANNQIPTLNTANLLLYGFEDGYLDRHSEKSDKVFKTKFGDRTFEIEGGLITKLQAINNSLGSRDDITGAFAGLQLGKNEINLLKKIADITLKYIERRNSGLSNDSGTSEVVLTFYLPKLISDIISIEQNTGIGAQEKQNAKRKLIDDFLPARRLVDISAFFDAKPNTVRFLGVDVKSDMASVVPHENGAHKTQSNLAALLEVCNAFNYKAVIFDSAAGTQSTAHALHYISDVIVYCMRPTRQFLEGTQQQLKKYRNVVSRPSDPLESMFGDKADGANNVGKIILLPTAVSNAKTEGDYFKNDSFEVISSRLAMLYNDREEDKGVIDSSFCSDESSLHEVELFKWYEMILGSSNGMLTAKDKMESGTFKQLIKYTSLDDMPADAKNAYRVYARLARRLVNNSKGQED